jgi:sRNA-binding protein
MTDSVSIPDAPQPSTEAANAPRRPRRRSDNRRRAAPAAPVPASNRPPRAHPPLLDELAGLYPHLFGGEPVPLKRGIFQDLQAAHPGAFEAEALKTALAFHTRSSRYLNAVAAGRPRHDLAGALVEPMAPEHVYQALVEVFRRRQARGQEDLRPKLLGRIAQAFDASGLSREAYDSLVRGRDDATNAVLDEALAEAAARAARDEALLRAFEAGSAPVDTFADQYGLDPRAVARTLERARQRRDSAAGR